MTVHRLRSVRLINFHNFIDVEIPVRGHLFLVGDNASGKTTVLDAVQWALSGGQDLEFNAAAQLWGAKQDGRNLRGAVLRTDLEKGDQRAGRTVTYAAVELESDKGDVLSAGVGAELAHPDAPLQTWGFLWPGPMKDVPLTRAEPDGATRPSTKEELREALGPDRVHFLIGRYQKMLADKFTRGDDAFRRLTEFWKVSKAYKQMAEKTRDYSELLRNMLPRPDGESIMQVKRGLEDLRAVEDRLEGLRAQRSYLQTLAGEWADIARHRESVARYRYLETRWEKDRVAAQIAAVEREGERAREEAARCADSLARVESDRAARESELLDLRAKDQGGLLERRDRLAREVEEAQRESSRSQSTSDALNAAVARAAQKVHRARRDFVSRWSTARSMIESLPEPAGPMVTAYTKAVAAVDDQALPEQAWAALDARPAREEVLEAQRRTDRFATDSEWLKREAEKEEERIKKAMEDLERTPDTVPGLPGYGACLSRLEQEGLKVRPLYQYLEKTASGDEGLFRDLEAALGDRVWAALVPDPQDAARVGELVMSEFPGIPVVRADLPEVPPSPWLESLVEWAPLPEEARRYLRRWAHDAPTPGVRLEGDGRVEVVGARLKTLAGEPLLGAQARRAAREKKGEETRLALGRVQDRIRELTVTLEGHRRSSASWRRVLTWLSETREGDFPRLARECQQALDAETRSREDSERARADAFRWRAEGERRAQALETVRARLAEEGLDDVESRLAAVEKALSEVRTEQTRQWQRQGELRQALLDVESRLRSLAHERSVAEERLAERAHLLAPLVAEEYRSDIDGYAWDVRQGRRIQSLDNVREKIREVERAHAMAVAHLQGEGGVNHAEYGPLFGLTYDEVSHQVTHRTGQSLTAFLEAFSTQVDEHASALDQDRQKLFREVIQGHLARKLQREIMDLEQTVRDVDRLLRARVFGRRTRYRIRFKPKEQHAHFISVVKRLAAFDAAGQAEFEAEIKDRLSTLSADANDVPESFDYRHWYEFQLMMGGETEDGVELKPTKARLGSGGEQAVPKYIIILAMATLLFRACDASVRLLLFDEVFYGIDKARREELLTLATEMDMQLVVASPEQAGDRESYRKATTAFVLKDADNNVHVVPAHIWVDRPAELLTEETHERDSE